MASNVVRMSPAGMPSQQGWVWNGSNWVWCSDPDDFPCPPALAPPFPCPPFPCPPSGSPTPCPPWFPPPAGQAPWYPGANGGVSFSATPPVNPVRGHFWWDGTMLHLFDGAVWVNIGPGAGASPGVPGVPGPSESAIVFAIQQPASVTLAGSAAWTIVPYAATPMVDTQGAWDASSHKYTPKVAGNYLFEARAVANGGSGIAIVKNDSGTFTSSLGSDIVIAEGSNTVNWMTAIGVASMNGSTDFMRIWAFATGGSFIAAGSSPVAGAVLLG